MTGFKSKKTAALDEKGMYLVHQTAQPAQEPMAWMGYDKGLKTFTAQQRIADAYPEIYTVPLYPSLPQRPWVDLTDEEISVLSKGHMTRNGFARNVLNKSKEKNNG